MTAAVGLQPASISALANGPEEPNAKAEPDREQQTEPEILRGAFVHGHGCTSGV